MHTHRRPPLGIVAQPETIAAARELVRRLGTVRACEELGVSRDALTRLVAALGVRPGTIAVVERALSAPRVRA